MKLFKDTQFTWWQIAMFKWAMFGWGLIFGATLATWVNTYIIVIAFITLVLSGYITVVWFQQHKN